MKKNIKNQGFALISVIAISTIALIVISVVLVVSVINLRMNFNLLQSQKAYLSSESISEDGILRYIRYRSVNNLYPDWTGNCLQVSGVECKMEISTTDTSGSFDSWGRADNKIRHFQYQLQVSPDDSVTISAKKEIN
jgi:hypothetical protein